MDPSTPISQNLAVATVPRQARRRNGKYFAEGSESAGANSGEYVLSEREQGACWSVLIEHLGTVPFQQALWKFPVRVLGPTKFFKLAKKCKVTPRWNRIETLK